MKFVISQIDECSVVKVHWTNRRIRSINNPTEQE